MSNLILQPAGGGGEKHLWTITDGVRLSKIKLHVDQEQLDALAGLYPGGVARIWGLTPGDGGRNQRKWSHFERDDIVLFCGQKRVFASALIQFKLHSARLAKALWGVD